MTMKIEKDKWKHFYVGIAMGMVLQLPALWFLPQSVFWISLIVLFLVVAASYGFELFSLITGLGHYDVMDAVAGVVGGLLGMAAAYGLWLWWW